MPPPRAFVAQNNDTSLQGDSTTLYVAIEQTLLSTAAVNTLTLTRMTDVGRTRSRGGRRRWPTIRLPAPEPTPDKHTSSRIAYPCLTSPPSHIFVPSKPTNFGRRTTV